jgi:hypothetical protein
VECEACDVDCRDDRRRAIDCIIIDQHMLAFRLASGGVSYSCIPDDYRFYNNASIYSIIPR